MGLGHVRLLGKLWVSSYVYLLGVVGARCEGRVDVQRAAGFDCAIVVPCRESMGGPDKVATFYSQTCIRYVLECVYGTVFARSYEKSRQYKTLAERELRQ